MYGYYQQYIQEHTGTTVTKPEKSPPTAAIGKTLRLEFFRHLEYELSRKLAPYPVSRDQKWGLQDW
jgi:hypothetical protein